MSPLWTLVVRTTFSDALDLDFADRPSLVAQLTRFEENGLSNPYRLHEFRNEKGILIAFTSKSYVSHRVEPPHADFP